MGGCLDHLEYGLVAWIGIWRDVARPQPVWSNGILSTGCYKDTGVDIEMKWIDRLNGNRGSRQPDGAAESVVYRERKAVGRARGKIVLIGKPSVVEVVLGELRNRLPIIGRLARNPERRVAGKPDELAMRWGLNDRVNDKKVLR